MTTSIIKEYRISPEPILNGVNAIQKIIIPETGTWVLQAGSYVSPVDLSVDNNLSELHICVSDNQLLCGPPDGGPDAGHIPYINRQGQIVNSAMAIRHWNAGDEVYNVLNTKFPNGQMQATAWMVGFKLP